MRDSEDVTNDRIVQQARSVSQGSRMNASTSGTSNIGVPDESTIVDSTGRVRRKWRPGYPWSPDFYFGGGSTDNV